MIAIAVDDEPLMLHALVKAIKASDDITTVTDFTSCEDALDFMKNNPADIAFLDINMRGMGGLSLAEKLSDFVLIVRSCFALVMRNMLSQHLSSTSLVI